MMTMRTTTQNQGNQLTSPLWIPLPEYQQELLSGGAPRQNGGNGSNGGGNSGGGTTGGRPSNGNRPSEPGIITTGSQVSPDRWDMD